MNALDLARWQFGIVTVYHFLFVPLTIGLAPLVAGLQTAWVRTGNVRYLRATKFWGKLFLINFALGVVTGIVQEFQFGMNWSDYSRYVGDIFGAPLAIEGLLAFFLESTFLGLWIFGWERLSKGVHLACIWLVSLGTMLSAFFILAANAWMQHPVGYTVDGTGPKARARLTDFVAVLTNSTAWVTFAHTIVAALVTGGAFVMGVAAWQLARGRDVDVFRPSLKLGAITVLFASLAVAVSGDLQAKVMTDQQPMKMAAAEALYSTSSPASFSLFTIGSLDGSKELFSLRVPGVLSFMATGSTSGTVEGINDVQAQLQQQYGPGDYRPNIPIAYWTFRLMIGFGVLSLLLSVLGWWFVRRGATPDPRRRAVRWFYRLALIGIAFPMVANATGWLFTEMGRQPWVVYGLLGTAGSESPGVGVATVATSLVTYTLVYGVLAVIEVRLMARTIRAGAPTEEQPQAAPLPAPALVY